MASLSLGGNKFLAAPSANCPVGTRSGIWETGAISYLLFLQDMLSLKLETNVSIFQFRFPKFISMGICCLLFQGNGNKIKHFNRQRIGGWLSYQWKLYPVMVDEIVFPPTSSQLSSWQGTRDWGEGLGGWDQGLGLAGKEE